MSKFMRLGLIALGNFLVAFAVVFFILPNDILSGGTATVALVLDPFIPGLSRVVLIVILNFALFLLGLIFLGKKFALSSFLSTVLYSLFISLLSLLDVTPFSQIDPLVAAVFAGLICGTGLGLVFRAHSSTGGMDIPALIIHKYLKIPQGTSVMIVDGLTILAGLYTYGLNSVLTGLFAVFASSYAINWATTLGAQPARDVMIISEKWEEIQDYLLHEVARGVTILEGRGAWSQKERPVLMCVVSNREYGQLESEIAKIDPKAFIIVTSVHEVRGSGFTYKDGTI